MCLEEILVTGPKGKKERERDETKCTKPSKGSPSLSHECLGCIESLDKSSTLRKKSPVFQHEILEAPCLCIASADRRGELSHSQGVIGIWNQLRI